MLKSSSSMSKNKSQMFLNSILERICCQMNSDQSVCWIPPITHSYTNVFQFVHGLCTGVGHRERRSVWETNRERNRQIVVALMCTQSSVLRIDTRWKKGNIIGQMSLCKPLQWRSVWDSVCVFAAIICKWLAHTHSCVQTIEMSITRSDKVERSFFSLVSSSSADNWHAFKGKQNSPHHI